MVWFAARWREPFVRRELREVMMCTARSLVVPVRKKNEEALCCLQVL